MSNPRARIGWPLALALALLAGVALHGAFADERDEDEEVRITGTLQGTQRAAAARVRIHDADLADAFAAGGAVEIERVEGDDVFVAGGSLRLRELSVEDLVAAGGEIRVQAQIRDDLLAAGGRVQVEPGTVIAGDAVLAGGEVELAGRIDGNATIGGGRVVLAGVVGGDVDVAAGELVVDARARIGGKLVYASEDTARIEPGAVIGGGVVHQATGAPEMSGWALAGIGIGALIVLLLGAALMAAVLTAVTSELLHRGGLCLQDRPGSCWLLGFALLVAVPVAANLLMISVVGIPLGLVVLAAYALGLILGVVTVAARLGRVVTRTTGSAHEAMPVRARSARAALGMALLLLIGAIPLLGWLALLALVPAGVGGFAMVCWRDLRSAPSGHASTQPQ
jgi:hypothetical protein